MQRDWATVESEYIAARDLKMMLLDLTPMLQSTQPLKYSAVVDRVNKYMAQDFESVATYKNLLSVVFTLYQGQINDLIQCQQLQHGYNQMAVQYNGFQNQSFNGNNSVMLPMTIYGNTSSGNSFSQSTNPPTSVTMSSKPFAQ